MVCNTKFRQLLQENLKNLKTRKICFITSKILSEGLLEEAQ